MKKKYSLIIAILALISVLLTACEKNEKLPHELATLPFNWENAGVVPFCGNITAYENSGVFFQLPLVYPADETGTVNIISQVNLIARDGEKIPCEAFSFTAEDGQGELKTASLSFSAVFAKAGEYVINGLEVVASGKSPVVFPLDDIYVTVMPKSEDILQCVGCTGMEDGLGLQPGVDVLLAVTYKNTGKSDAVFKGLSFEAPMLADIEILGFYKDPELKEESRAANIIAAGEEITVSYKIRPSGSHNGENAFILPLASYNYLGEAYEMPAQYVPVVIKPFYEEAYLRELLNKV